MSPEVERKASRWLVLATILACFAQIVWFARTSFGLFDYDALSYLGIASYLRHGNFHAAINAFRSPLISWLVALASFLDADLLRVGKLINIGSFLISVVLVYWLAKRLWQSQFIGAIACLWFSLARGLAAAAVVLVSPDFLLTALVLAYFLLLLRCVRFNRGSDWFLLGGVHGLAYLAKAFALPWLALASVAAIIMSVPKFSQRMQRLALAGILPLVISAAWTSALYSKYGVLTTGSQFQANFIAYNGRSFRQGSYRFAVLQDTSPEASRSDPSFLKVDAAMVNDPLPPASPAWHYRPTLRQMLPLIVSAERRTLPGALKEMTILLTPGGVAGFVLIILLTMRRKSQLKPEFYFMAIVALSGTSLLLAYSMLVFLTTYAFPVTALIVATTARIFVSDDRFPVGTIFRWTCSVLAIAGLLVSFVYHSSPFRTLDRDFEAGCRDAASKLATSGGSSLISVGTGPYPGQGVGWEAGFVTAHFAHRRILGSGGLPTVAQLPIWTGDITRSAPDAVLVWGRPGDANYQLALETLEGQFRTNLPIQDPRLGEVGRVVLRPTPNSVGRANPALPGSGSM